jgi:hypothetical protein
MRIIRSWRTVAILFVVILGGMWLLSTSGLIVSDEARSLREAFGL